jgi:L-lactate dehydrogenase complex protein LldF
LRFERVRSDGDDITLGQGSQRHGWEPRIWSGWSWLHAHPSAYRLGTRIATRLRWLLPRRLGNWTKVRATPRVAKQTLHELAEKNGFHNE